MLYFIPGWYADGAWHEQEQYWHARRMHTEFDDTVKHIQLFHRNKICPFQILLLSFTPNFRHFLHRQGVYHAPYWSCFDAIQGITKKKIAQLSYHNIKWPEGTEFLYTMFVVVAIVNGEKFAEIQFGEDGNLIEIEMFSHGRTVRKNIYDDRGFVASSIVYHEGKPSYQDYLGEDGAWRIRQFFSDGRIKCNPKYASFRLEIENQIKMIPFKKERYVGLEELLEEVLSAYIACTKSSDIFCAAVHPLHMHLISRTLKNRNLAYSLFEERNNLEITVDNAELLSAAGQLICDSMQGSEVLSQHGNGMLPPCTVITPFDTRPDFGISQQMTTQKILIPVDGLYDSVLDQLIQIMGAYMEKNQHAEVYLFTRKAAYGLDKALKNKAQRILEAAGYEWEPEESEETEETAADEFLETEQTTMAQRWYVEQCVDELSVTKCLRMQRLIVDCRQIRDVYLRVVAVSMGIPQILMRPSEFVIPGKNGVVLQKTDELSTWLDFYLAELNNWNKAMIAAYEVGKKYDTAAQVQRWKGVIDSFG